MLKSSLSPEIINQTCILLTGQLVLITLLFYHFAVEFRLNLFDRELSSVSPHLHHDKKFRPFLSVKYIYLTTQGLKEVTTTQNREGAKNSGAKRVGLVPVR